MFFLHYEHFVSASSTGNNHSLLSFKCFSRWCRTGILWNLGNHFMFHRVIMQQKLVHWHVQNTCWLAYDKCIAIGILVYIKHDSNQQWLGIVCTAASSSQKGSHQETRDMVTYDDDDIFWHDCFHIGCLLVNQCHKTVRLLVSSHTVSHETAADYIAR